LAVQITGYGTQKAIANRAHWTGTGIGTGCVGAGGRSGATAIVGRTFVDILTTTVAGTGVAGRTGSTAERSRRIGAGGTRIAPTRVGRAFVDVGTGRSASASVASGTGARAGTNGVGTDSIGTASTVVGSAFVDICCAVLTAVASGAIRTYVSIDHIDALAAMTWIRCALIDISLTVTAGVSRLTDTRAGT